jgi:hypothetical protein
VSNTRFGRPKQGTSLGWYGFGFHSITQDLLPVYLSGW